jgi:hypothetical protein
MRGTDDGGETCVAARVYVWAELALGGVREVHPSLYRGVGGVRKD